jgi:hypothetical protein
MDRRSFFSFAGGLAAAAVLLSAAPAAALPVDRAPAEPVESGAEAKPEKAYWVYRRPRRRFVRRYYYRPRHYYRPRYVYRPRRRFYYRWW